MHHFKLWLLLPTKLFVLPVEPERVHPYPQRLHRNFLRVSDLVQSPKTGLWNLSLVHQLLPQGSGQVHGPANKRMKFTAT